MMNRITAEALGSELGVFVEVDVDKDGKAVGSFLRVKARLDIRIPLMRGIIVLVKRDGREVERWCTVQYEFLPDFCYICGLLGHTDKMCEIKLARGETRHFNGLIRFTPQRNRLEGGGRGGNQGWRSSQGGGGVCRGEQ